MMPALLLLGIGRIDQNQAQARAYADGVPASKHLFLQVLIGCPASTLPCAVSSAQPAASTAGGLPLLVWLMQRFVGREARSVFLRSAARTAGSTEPKNENHPA